MSTSIRRCAFVVAMGLMATSLAHGQSPLILGPNMKQLNAEMPSAAARLLSSNAPMQLFYPGEKANVTWSIEKGAAAGETEMTVEIQEITQRDPTLKVEGMEGFTDTGGQAPLIGLEGDPITVPLKVAFDDQPAKEVSFELPIPEKFGTYAMILVRGGERRFVHTVCRLPQRREYGTLENTPIFGEGQFFGGPASLRPAQAQAYARMGIRGWRSELSWSEGADGKVSWEHYDPLFKAAEDAGCQIMVTLGGHAGHFRPFGEPTPAANWRPDSGGYWGTGHWLSGRDLFPRYGEWITKFCDRYWKDGKGGLWGLENYNEPWEGGGISGWAADCLYYRDLQILISDSAAKVSEDIKICAASSIMNTEDKLYSDGSDEFDKHVDVFTDHYVVPPMCYGPMVAERRGKQSIETETWIVNSEFLLPQTVAQFMAAGQDRIAPWHPRVLFDSGQSPTPAVAATAAFNYFVTGKTFEKVVFREHLPWVFQFGKDDDKDALLVMFGQLLPIFNSDHKTLPWPQVSGIAGGTITIDNADGLLSFHDLAGNPLYVGQASVTLPMNLFPTYILSKEGPVKAAERIAAAKIEGRRFIEIIPRDFTTRVTDDGAQLVVRVVNRLNRPVSGKLMVTAPDEATLASNEAAVELAAGEGKDLSFLLASAKPDAGNAFDFGFKFTSPDGEAEYREIMHQAVIVKATPAIDGNLDDWKDIPGVTVVAGAQAADLFEQMRRPWLQLKDQLPDGNYGEFKLAWDDNYLYVAATVNDKTPMSNLNKFDGRDQDKYFHSAESDSQSPYKEFIEARPGRSFAEVPYVYRWSPEGPPAETGLPVIPFRRDRLHIGLDVTDGWHDLKPTTDRVPLGFHAWPDTDYEYSLYQTTDGSEVWRHLAPGVPRIHDFPRQKHGEKSTGVVPGAKHAAKYEGTTYTYELAIPRQELADLKLAPGSTLGIMLRGGNQSGPHVDFGLNKAATKLNGLTLHPYWEISGNCGVRWTLVD